jgi:phosphoribosylformimino-5-aminoimidazole carboxamide ribotide isomerase
MEIIPAIDIMDGKCVRLTEGDYNTRKQYHANPVEVAQAFEQAGIKRLHVVDLDGARAKKVVNSDTLAAICKATALIVDFGGGVRTDEDLAKAFDAGARMITCGSVAIKNPDLAARWISKYGGDKMILGADVKNGSIAVNGWEEESQMAILPFLKQYTQMGFKKVICTDVSKDGKLEGPSFALYQEIIDAFPDLELIASGGISSVNDLTQLAKARLYGAIVGKAIYENRISMSDLKPFI